MGGWLVGKLIGSHFFGNFFVDSSTKMGATLRALTLNPRALGWPSRWLDLAGWMDDWLGQPPGWLGAWLAGWLASWLAVWLAGWRALLLALFCRQFHKNGCIID